MKMAFSDHDVPLQTKLQIFIYTTTLTVHNIEKCSEDITEPNTKPSVHWVCDLTKCLALCSTCTIKDPTVVPSVQWPNDLVSQAWPAGSWKTWTNPTRCYLNGGTGRSLFRLSREHRRTLFTGEYTFYDEAKWSACYVWFINVITSCE